MEPFDGEWFARHQGAMLALANTRAGRRLLRIDGDLPARCWVVGIQPHAVTWTTEPLIPWLRSVRRGEPVTLTTDFRTHEKFGKRLRFSVLPRWERVGEIVRAAWSPLGVRVAWADTLTVYPQPGAGGGNTTCDGQVFRGTSGTFSAIRDGAGTGVDAFGIDASLYRLLASTTSNVFSQLYRSIFTFSTSALGSSATLSAAVLSWRGSLKASGLGTDSANVVAATPAANNSLVSADYGQLGAVAFATVAYSSLSTTGYQDFTLDSNGRANVSKTGISRFGLRGGWDLNNSFTGTWASNQTTRWQGYYADQTGTSTDPKLVVTYTLPAKGLPLFLAQMGGGFAA
ncbi:hypothetical protein FJZ36_15180 [Candidatus Poribacteria bacterium]|nr:hypothetical protein [Candidatus Poribacteria bacterium]